MEPEETRGEEAEGKLLMHLKVEDLSYKVKQFLEKIGSMLESTPEKVGDFRFEEFEVHADVTATGKIALFGTGAEAGGSGGLRFVFRRPAGSSNEKRDSASSD